MIMQWKKDDDFNYVAAWQGIQFLLYQNPATERWQLRADGVLVKQTWTNKKLAMDTIDARQHFLIRKNLHQADVVGKSAPKSEKLRQYQKAAVALVGKADSAAAVVLAVDELGGDATKEAPHGH